MTLASPHPPSTIHLLPLGINAFFQVASELRDALALHKIFPPGTLPLFTLVRHGLYVAVVTLTVWGDDGAPCDDKLVGFEFCYVHRAALFPCPQASNMSLYCLPVSLFASLPFSIYRITRLSSHTLLNAAASLAAIPPLVLRSTT